MVTFLLFKLLAAKVYNNSLTVFEPPSRSLPNHTSLPTKPAPVANHTAGAVAGGPFQLALGALSSWSLSKYKYTKQYVAERLGRSSRTVDAEVESRVEALRESQRQYAHVLRLARALAVHFQHVVQTQRALGDAFGELSQRSAAADLGEQFSYNAETHRLLSKNGDALLGEDLLIRGWLLAYRLQKSY